MTGRGTKRRGRPPKTANMDRQSAKLNYSSKKPKYLADSQVSTPSASRASSPQGSDNGSASRRGRPSTSRKGGRGGGRGRKRGSGAHQNNKSYSRKSYETDYHYGSDFGDSSDENEVDDDLLLSPESDSDSLEPENENNDSDFSLSSFSNESNLNKRGNRVPSPDPLWLQPIELPRLVLPDSSDDLLVPRQYALKLASIYEVFRRFRQLLRLTPFRMEDFCAALMSDELSSLLTEIHIMILRALLREEDAQGTQFGPQDHKDSINISMYLIDQITWPEVLRSYLESHDSFDRASLNILASKDYPFVEIDDRITVLQFLTDQFLITDIVRGDLAREVPIIYDDHCRICHKLGDLVCCETCPAVFHLECVDPPLENVPAGDYQCNLCKVQQVPGVYDCISSLEKQGFLCRHEHLGFDRHGRKYWFINRRVYVEDEESGEIWYYSSVPQFKELYSRLDEDNMEQALCAEILDFAEEIERQMTITEALTNKHKGHKKSYLELENQNILKKDKANDSDTETNKNAKNDDAKADDKDAEEEKQINDNAKEKEVDEVVEPPKNVVSTRLKTGSLTPRNYNTDDLKRKATKDDTDSEQRMTRLKNANLNTPFKLGQQGAFKFYVNQYTTNVYALNKPQRNEDRDKKRPLSHKFSLTQASDFKWSGALNGNRTSVIATLRQTMIALDQTIASPFMHPHWSTLRKLWLQALANCNKPIDFAKALIIFQMCSKNCIYVNAWHEQLAHIKLERITSMERDEKKKSEKREKRERDDEEERNRLAINFVKYSIPQKHQVAKQKGEEYRIHGQWSWVWMAHGRRKHTTKGNTGERIKPNNINMQIEHNDTTKIVALEPATYDYVKKQIETKNVTNVSAEIIKANIVPVIETFDRLDVTSALLAENRLLYPKIAKKSSLDDLLKRRVQLKIEEEQRIERKQTDVDDGAAASAANAAAKPKGRKLTDTEKLLKRLAGIKAGTSTANASTNGQQTTQNIDMDYVNEMAEAIIKIRDRHAQLNRLAKQYKCYPSCEASSSSYSLSSMKKDMCYSPLCTQKVRVREELLLALKRSAAHGDAVKDTIMNIVNRKPSHPEPLAVEGKIGKCAETTDASSDVNPSKLQRNFLHALEKCAISDFDRDVMKHIVLNEPKEEPVAKLEPMEQIEMNGIKSESTEHADAKADANPTEMDVDNHESKANATNSIANDSAMDVVDEDNVDVVEKVDENENGDVRERRSSRRSAKRRMSVRQSATKAIARNGDNTDDAIAKLRSKDASFNASRSLIPNQFGDINVIYRPNRRFNTTPRTNKREDRLKYEKEYAADGSERVFSGSSTSGKIYLVKILPDHDPTKPITGQPIGTAAPLKYPPMYTFLSKTGFRSILNLQTYEQRKLARCHSKMVPAGFNLYGKSNTAVWPYPCPRPLFRTCWLYRTLNSRTLSSVAMQLRILWVSLRWDDMSTKPPTFNGKVVNNTETGIHSTEIMKSRIRGRFSERTEFFRFTLIIPYGYADPPSRDISENTPSRSGLRKRKRPDTPQKTEKQTTEEWVEEDKLQLWEIKFFGEKFEKQLLQPVTRTSTGKLPISRANNESTPHRPNATVKTVVTSTPINKQVVVGAKASVEEIKEKMEQELRQQRAEHHKKRTLEMMQQKKDPIKGPVVAQRKIIVRNPDGTTKVIVQNVVSTQANKPVADGAATANQPVRQKLGITRGVDGKITSVTGLQPGQQLIESPQGLRIVTTTTPNRSDRKVIVKSELPKVISKVPTGGQDVAAKAPIVIRTPIQTQTQTRPANVIVKSVTNKTMAPATAQRVILNNAQVVSSPTQQIVTSKRQIAANSVQQKIIRTSSIQQVVGQGGQKFVINPNNTGNKIILASTPNNQVVNSTVTSQAIIQNSTNQQQAQQQQQIVVSQPAQKVIQQQEYVNPTNQQQQIILHGQRIVLNPGQRIQVTQQQPTQTMQQQVIQQISQPQQITQTVQQPTQQILIQRSPQAVSQIQTVQQQPQQQQQQPQQQQQATQQIVVNNSLAQMLTQGKVQMANVNGQQVLIKPIGNNQWHIVAHLKNQADGTLQIVPTNNSTAESQQQPQQNIAKPVQTVVAQQKIVVQPQATVVQATTGHVPQQSSSGIPAALEQSLLQGQPPGTVIKCVTAEVTKNQNGACIKLTGLQGSDLTEQQLSLVHQQVKQQLVKKAQEQNGNQALGPTKIFLAVQPAQTQLPLTQKPTDNRPTGSQPQTIQTVMINGKDVIQRATVSTAEVSQNVTSIKDGVVNVVNESQMPKPIESQEQIAQPKQQTITTSADEPTTSTSGAADAVKIETQPSEESSIVTADYIQQTIRNALKQQNINPEIEEKLLNLQSRHERKMKGNQRPTSEALMNNHHEYSSPMKSRKHTSSRNDDDDDWLMDTPKRRPPRAGTYSDRRPSIARTITNPNQDFSRANQSAIDIESSTSKISNTLIPTPKKQPRDIPVVIAKTPIKPIVVSPTKTPSKTPIKTPIKSPVKMPTNVNVKVSHVSPVSLKSNANSDSNTKSNININGAEETIINVSPKREIDKNKQLQAKLLRQKEQLKRDILSKRVVLEKELQTEIRKELATELVERSKLSESEAAQDNDDADSLTTPSSSPMKKRVSVASAKKQAAEEAKTAKQKTVTETTRKTAGTSSVPKKLTVKQRRTQKLSSLSKKKERIVCVCRKPFDESKFYVGCDLCSNWFHGDCVGISEEKSKEISEYVCSECKHARDTQELYCICRQPYDETQFYICCDKCQDWFHGRCVGILQCEAENIDEYICPNCQKNNSVNYANMKEMGSQEYDSLKKLIKQIQSHKSAWPFLEPVDQKEAPDYYNLIKDPMDLQKVDSKINDKIYSKLSEFIADMTKIFDNCRFYNPKESAFYRCAESLEAFFVQKIKNLRDTLIENQ